MKAFGCDEGDFLDLILHAMSSFQPPQCRDLSSKAFAWVLKYGVSGCERQGNIGYFILVTAIISLLSRLLDI